MISCFRASFSLRKNVSGIHIFVGSVSVKYFRRPKNVRIHLIYTFKFWVWYLRKLALLTFCCYKTTKKNIFQPFVFAFLFNIIHFLKNMWNYSRGIFRMKLSSHTDRKVWWVCLGRGLGSSEVVALLWKNWALHCLCHCTLARGKNHNSSVDWPNVESS